jgi:serine/threonine-protein kinase
MGTVHRADDLRLGRAVALKRLRVDLAADPLARQRFEHEARAAAALSHPNIVTVLDVGTDVDGVPYIVLEWLPGPTLADELTTGALPPARVGAIGVQVLAALSHAHRHGLLHRDVKPSNIILTAEGDAKLADYGIAKTLDGHDLTTSGDLVGTIRYMAPERLRGQPATPASDLYSLGMVLREALTGTPAYGASSPGEVAYAVTHTDLPRLSGVGSIGTVVDRAIEREPIDRYATAADMAAALSVGQPDPATAAWARGSATDPTTHVARPVDAAATATVSSAAAPTEHYPTRAAPDAAAPEQQSAAPRSRRRRALVAGALLVALVVAASLVWAAGPGSTTHRAPPPTSTTVTTASTTTTLPAPTTTVPTAPPTTRAAPPPGRGEAHPPHGHGHGDQGQDG